MIIHILDVVSVFAFAFFGANAGLAQRFSFLGVLTCAFLPALGGGTIREMMLNHMPLYFHDYSYGAAVVAGAVFAVLTVQIARVKRYMYVLDALGMIVFAYIGSRAALRAGLGLGGSLVFAVLTACGGGILCDVITRQVPHAFKHRLYAVPPLLLGFLLWLTGSVQTPLHIRWIFITGAFALQLAITYRIVQKLPEAAPAARPEM